MKTRTLGTNGFEIGEVGLGCWQLGGTEFGPLDEETAHQILSAAKDSGSNFFDTANVYGAGRSESLIGKYLQEHGEGITVASKTGREVYPDGYSEENLRKSILESSEKLGLNCLDLVQLHCVPHPVLREGAIFDWLRALRDEGLIRHFGASVESVDEGLTCLQHEDLLSLQVIFNPFRQKLIDELFPRAAELGVGIIVRLPLASGLLTGKFSTETTFGEDDHRNFNRDGACFNVGETFAGIPFERGLQLADQLRPLVPEGMTMAQMSQRWILDFEAVSVIIPGASSPEQARENATVSTLSPLSAELHDTLRQFYSRDVHEHIRGPY
ncbi:MAG: aldo/keto reductase [Roseibacillus sp.]|jgi:aryl-alcohol dehydrogenase-like predicted oxidoreductase|nr:aldo/keto reductase [Roseibacillus sp.]MDP6208555.1 aldo/keto reductase [Roseibacillus sp.]HJM65421.1 aldo/keto reductase [Roseibacillus sp.]|tara:strand:- start:3254 stop:4231 length:978 start_codon:yes stop_codon:yes gene_type:complete